MEAAELGWFTPAGTPMNADGWNDPEALALGVYLDGSDAPDTGPDGQPLLDDRRRYGRPATGSGPGAVRSWCCAARGVDSGFGVDLGVYRAPDPPRSPFPPRYSREKRTTARLRNRELAGIPGRGGSMDEAVGSNTRGRYGDTQEAR
ncbi:MAG TPA: hypothetical protein VGD83_01660 [Streptosporangiaceae bacterium]